MKVCIKCSKELPEDCFCKDAPRADGRCPYCKSCVKARRTYGKKEREYRRTQYRLKTYGIDSKSWDDLFESQGRKCAVCKSDNPGKNDWHTDHDHDTEKIRGILCSNCNTALGLLKDDIIRLKAAIEYLSK